MKWIKASERLPEARQAYFLRHPYADGRASKWVQYVVREAIDKEYWIKMGYEWLDESEPDPSEILLEAFKEMCCDFFWECRMDVQKNSYSDVKKMFDDWYKANRYHQNKLTKFKQSKTVDNG